MFIFRFIFQIKSLIASINGAGTIIVTLETWWGSCWCYWKSKGLYQVGLAPSGRVGRRLVLLYRLDINGFPFGENIGVFISCLGNQGHWSGFSAPAKNSCLSRKSKGGQIINWGLQASCSAKIYIYLFFWSWVSSCLFSHGHAPEPDSQWSQPPQRSHLLAATNLGNW